jgi:hypothetical protein
VIFMQEEDGGENAADPPDSKPATEASKAPNSMTQNLAIFAVLAVVLLFGRGGGDITAGVATLQ